MMQSLPWKQEGFNESQNWKIYRLLFGVLDCRQTDAVRNTVGQVRLRWTNVKRLEMAF